MAWWYEAMVAIVWSGIITIFIVLSMFPFIPFLFIWSILWFRSRDKKTAVNLAIDGTVPFLIFSVSAMYDETVGTQFNGIYLILLFLLLLTGLIGNLQHRIKGEINKKKLFRAVWRIAFMVLAPSYVLLVIAGIVKAWLA